MAKLTPTIVKPHRNTGLYGYTVEQYGVDRKAEVIRCYAGEWEAFYFANEANLLVTGGSDGGGTSYHEAMRRAKKWVTFGIIRGIDEAGSLQTALHAWGR